MIWKEKKEGEKVDPSAKSKKVPKKAKTSLMGVVVGENIFPFAKGDVKISINTIFERYLIK